MELFACEKRSLIVLVLGKTAFGFHGESLAARSLDLGPIDYVNEIIEYECVYVLESVVHAVELGHADEVVEVVTGELLEEVLLAKFDDEQTLKMRGGRKRVEHVRVSVKSGAGRVEYVEEFV